MDSTRAALAALPTGGVKPDSGGDPMPHLNTAVDELSASMEGLSKDDQATVQTCIDNVEAIINAGGK